MSYLIGISGPPRSGKDTLGSVLAGHIMDRFGVQAQIIQQSLPMRHMIFSLMGLEYSLVMYEREKDTPQKALAGRSIREAMIALSEQHVKPLYGKGQWARAALNRRWVSKPKIVIVTDMGFDEEVAEFESEYGFNRCLWPQLARAGHSFASDSRTYVGRPELVIPLDNSMPLKAGGQAFFQAAAREIGNVIEHRGWALR